MEKQPRRPQVRFGPGPWPTADSLRLALLARLQDAETVDLVEFFRQAYPQVLELCPLQAIDSETQQEVRNV